MSNKASEMHGSARLHITPVDDEQIFITATVPQPTDTRQAATDIYSAVGKLLSAGGYSVVHERIFGSLSAHDDVLAARQSALSSQQLDPATPATYLQGNPLWGNGLAGVNFLAVVARTPKDVWMIRDEAGQVRGRGWNRFGTRFLMLQNLNGQAEAGEDRNTQADRMFDRADQLLRGQKVDYRSVTRTWLYLNRILSWYDDFNKVRNAKYGLFGLMPSVSGTNGSGLLLPASTGIEASTPAGAAVTMDLLATELASDSPVQIHQMTNRKQKDAFKYGSAFSRGAAIRLPKATWISLSGTAAIDEVGVTMHLDDFKSQMETTLDIVEALIAQEGASLHDLCDLTCFVKLPEFVPLYHAVLAERGLTELAGVPVIADVCRHDLLFEMDGAAVVRRA